MTLMRFTKFIEEELLLMAGQAAERQETGFVNAINEAVGQAGAPITVVSKDLTVKNVIGASKYEGRSTAGTEPYTDVIIEIKGGKPLNISMKGSSAPSLAGGGLKGMELVIPGIGRRFMEAALKNHLKNKLEPGSKVPDTYAKLNDSDKLKLVIGDKKMGGPIDMMYVGPMDVVSTFDHFEGSTSSGTLRVNGKLIDATKYANEHDLYFRLRARREDQPFDPSAKDRAGIPTVYGRSPTKGDKIGRIVVTDKPAKGRDMITF